MARYVLIVVALCAAAVPALAWTASAPVTVTSEDSLDPRVAIDPNGAAHVVWRERTGGSVFQIWYSSDAAGAFSSPAQISQGGSAASYSPVIAADGPDVYAAWTSDQSGSNFEIYYRRKSGGSWGSILNASNTAIKSLRPAIAVRAGVGPIVTWDEALYADDNYDVLFSEWTGSGFGAAYNLSNTPGGAVYGSVNSNCAISPNGDLTVVWAERISGQYRVNARRRVGGVWQPRVDLSTKQTGPSTPGIAAGADNQVHVVYNADGWNWYQKWNGSAWTAPQALPGGLNDPLRPKIAVDDYGFAHVVLDDSHYGVGEIYYSTNSSGAWSPWLNISNTPQTNSVTADIAHSGGALVVVWNENSAAGGGTGVFNIWSARHNVPPLGPAGTISGVVRDQFGSGISNVTVSVGAYRTATAGGGAYSLSVPVGTYTVSAVKTHYDGESIPGVEVAQNQTVTVNLTVTAYPPDAVAEFFANPSDRLVRLSWTNPQSANFTGTRVVVRTDRFPSGPYDGSYVCDVAGFPGGAGSFTHTGLTNGSAYYYSAFAHDADGHYSPAVSRSAVPRELTCWEIKQLPDGALTDLVGKTVSAVFTSDGCIYVQEPDRSSGIRVATTMTGLAVGDVLNVSGAVSTRVLSGRRAERQITGAAVTKVSSGGPCDPVGMTCAAVGGAATDEIPGVKTGTGLNNMGLLVRTAGEVTYKSGLYIFVDDGSGVENLFGTSVSTTGVMVRCAVTPAVSVGDTVSVTGIVEGSVPNHPDWDTNRRYIHARTENDLRKH